MTKTGDASEYQASKVTFDDASLERIADGFLARLIEG